MEIRKFKLNTNIIYLLAVLFLMALYFIVLWRMLDPASVANFELVILGIFVLTIAGALLFSLFTLLAVAFARNRADSMKKLRGQMIFFVSVIALLVVFVAASQWMAYTPAILGENGMPLPNGIASMEKVKLGGVDQWLIIRGQDVNKPVLLFLSGGPGGSEAARVIRFNQELEKHFVVVIWEQRGCGKSYPSLNPKADLTIDQYTSDIIELTDILRARFDENKIYLMGHSWGSIIGVRAVQERPDLFHAYIGFSQMVDALETDKLIYQMMMEHSIKTGDIAFVNTLEAQGEPPYLGESPIQPYSTLFGREYSVYEYTNIKSEEYRRDGDILLLMLKQPEYGWLDRLYYLLGLINTFNAVYPQLQDMDLRLDAARLDLPVYLLLGRHDLNNPFRIPEEYFNLLDAPSKQIFFFEVSGHGMIWEEAEKFHDIMINTVLPDTYH